MHKLAKVQSIVANSNFKENSMGLLITIADVKLLNCPVTNGVCNHAADVRDKIPDGRLLVVLHRGCGK